MVGKSLSKGLRSVLSFVGSVLKNPEFVVACFLSGGAKDLSAPPPMLDIQCFEHHTV